MDHINDFPLEEAMIHYAATSCSKVYLVFGWELFKMDYDCTETADELFNMFWDIIMPNIDNYDVVELYVYADELAALPNPREIPIVQPTYKNVTVKPYWMVRKEELEEREKARFYDPEMLALKAFLGDHIKNVQPKTGENLDGSRPLTMSRGRYSEFEGNFSRGDEGHSNAENDMEIQRQQSSIDRSRRSTPSLGSVSSSAFGEREHSGSDMDLS